MQPSQRSDRLDNPLAGTPDGAFGGLGRLRHRPCLVNDSLTEQPALGQAERRVSVQIRSGPVLDANEAERGPAVRPDPGAAHAGDVRSRFTSIDYTDCTALVPDKPLLADVGAGQEEF